MSSEAHDVATRSIATEFTLRRRLGQRMHAFSNVVQAAFSGRTEQPVGIALPEWRVLRAALLTPGTSQAEVAAGEGINVMSVSRAVAGLKRKGLIEVDSDPADRRRVMLKPTPLGDELGAEIGARELVMYDHIFSVLSASEQEVLDELMARVNDHVQGAELPPPPPVTRDWASIFAANEAD